MESNVEEVEEVRTFKPSNVKEYLDEMGMNEDEFMDYMKQVIKNLMAHIERIKEETDHITTMLTKLNPLALKATGFSMIMSINIMGEPLSKLAIGSVYDNTKQALDILQKVKENSEK